MVAVAVNEGVSLAVVVIVAVEEGVWLAVREAVRDRALR
jgi:hypothetical protein